MTMAIGDIEHIIMESSATPRTNGSNDKMTTLVATTCDERPDMTELTPDAFSMP